jgi:hypothetical protein
MADNPQPASLSSGQQHKLIPEMELNDFQKLMKSHFGVGSEPTDREYLVRFVGQPFKEEADACRALSVMTHNRGTKVSPHNIKQVLAKFGISEEQFLEAFNLLAKGVSPIRPSTPAEIKEAS